ncbi:alpha/beta fold hydrolase [Bacillus weihaiensis]|uniref:3-oxoadipate enol-lactonase n=1 Tax=Bacillus weihaiensis TaxID=1547283 RepID=A0A1L3MVB1_9BACI|nr:alpha/beta hydrolase [Bacillus weihaiensis]APH06273.1 3-oxoadipate enol-lactonase [Bacillus weihaiensis]
MTLPTVQKAELSNGETLAYRKRDGGKETILLIHGNMTSSVHWDLFFETFPEQYTVIAVDLRGFGESTYHNRVRSIQDFSEDLFLFIQEVGLKDVTVIGWSTGGAVAMQLIADHPDFYKKLILLASASTRGYPFYGTKADGSADLSKRLQTIEEIEQDQSKTIPIQAAYDTNNREMLRAIWNALIYTKNQPDKERYEKYVDDMRTQRNLADVYHSLNTFNISSSGTNQVKDITRPVLVLRGDRDLVISKEMAEETVEDFGGHASFIELTDCGHSPLVDDLEQLNKTIIEFIEN